MAARYQVRLKDQAGVQVAIITDWRRLEYTKRVNRVDTCKLTIDGEAPAVDLFVVDGQIEVWRRDDVASPVVANGIDYEGFHRLSQHMTDQSSLSTFLSASTGYDHLLTRRVIYYRPGDAEEAKTGPAETVMKEYVDENAGPGAVSPPRIGAGVFPGLSIEADLAAGAAWEGARSFRELLETLQGIADATDFDFGVVGIGPALFEFQARAIWGDDRTTAGLVPLTGLNGAGNAPVIFALGFGNMQSPDYSLNRINEVTAAIILGQGSEGNRTVEEQASAAVADSPWNRVESVQQANSETTVGGLDAVGDAILEKLQAKEEFTFEVVQIPGLLYGRDYYLGDLVTARYRNIERNKQIVEVTVVVEAGREDISVKVGDVA